MFEKDSKDIQNELIGKIIIFGFPIYFPILLILYWIFYPDKVNAVLKIALPYIKTGTLTLIIALILTLTLLTIRWIIVRKNEKKRYLYYRILPHIKQEIEYKNILEMLEQFAGYRRGKHKRWLKGREWFQWLIYCGDEDEISFYIGFPADRKSGVLRTLQNAYKDAEFHFVPATQSQYEKLQEQARRNGKDESKITNILPFPKSKDWSGRMYFDSSGIERALPFKTYSGDDGISNLISYMEPGTWVDVSFSPSTRSTMRKTLKKAQKKLKKRMPKASERDSFQKEELKDYSSRLSGRDKVFKIAVSIASSHNRNKAIVSSIATNIGTVVNDKNGLDFTKIPNAISFCPSPISKTMEWTGQELANLIQLPDTESEVFQEHIKHLRKGQRYLKSNELNNGVTIGYMLHPLNIDRKIKIAWKQLTEHFFLSGQTGAGKSSILMMMLQSIIDEWIQKPDKTPGFTFIDPASVSAKTVMNRLRKAEHDGHAVPWNKVHYIRLKDGDNPIAMNLLHKNEWEDTDTVVNNIMDLFKTIYPGEKTRIDKYLKNTLTALIDDSKNHTLFGINKFLSDEDWREPIIERMTDEILKAFWQSQNQKDIDAVKEDIYSRVNAFEQSEFMRLIFGQPKWSLPIRKFMDEGHLVFVDTQGLGRINTKLIVGHIITQYHQVCQQRPQNTKEHFLIQDESHMAQIPIMDEIIAFDRKFGLCLGLATQYIGQFEPWLQKAIDGNVQNIISGSQGESESHIASKLTKNSFESDLLQYLPNNHAAVLTKNKTGKQTKLTSCLINSDPPFLYKPDGEVAKYPDEEEQKLAMEWADEKAQELQERDGEDKEKIKDYYLNYLGLQTITSAPATDSFFKGGDASRKEKNSKENESDSELYSPPGYKSDILDEVENVATGEETNEKTEKEENNKPFSFFS
ncbi:hypothetical protein [Halobacillus sp. H74]|uniref:hypothetical protein n=1 Tax=Halobacillus sp. H74 TaxID=3457436 RepID=UPI003FCE203B